MRLKVDCVDDEANTKRKETHLKSIMLTPKVYTVFRSSKRDNQSTLSSSRHSSWVRYTIEDIKDHRSLGCVSRWQFFVSGAVWHCERYVG